MAGGTPLAPLILLDAVPDQIPTKVPLVPWSAGVNIKGTIGTSKKADAINHLSSETTGERTVDDIRLRRIAGRSLCYDVAHLLPESDSLDHPMAQLVRRGDLTQWSCPSVVGRSICHPAFDVFCVR